MNFKSLSACLYLLFAYWVSSQYTELKMFFYPTLGAYCYFFISRTLHHKDYLKIIVFSCFAAAVSSILYYLSPGMMTLFITCMLTIFIINIFNLNAAPIVAVVLIPYFSNLSSVWLLPLSVFCSLGGLFITLCISGYLEERWNQLNLKSGVYSLRKNERAMEEELTL